MKDNLRSLLFIITIISTVSLPVYSQNIAEVKSHAGVPSLFLNGELIPPFAYMSYLPEERFYKNIAQTGLHLYCFPAYLGDQGINASSGIGLFRSPIWLGENDFDFSSLEEDFKKLIVVDSCAKVIVRIYLDPPIWWQNKNPDQACFTADGKRFRQCFASRKWKEETAVALTKCLDWLNQSPYAKHLIGIHVAAGSTEEWFYHAPQRIDKNPLKNQEFRNWLKMKYSKEALLRVAWQDNNVSFSSATFADADSPVSHNWLNPVNEQRRIDSYQFHSEIMVDNIAYFCKIVKDHSQRKWLTGAFYGYHNMITDPRYGHFALSKLLSCPDIDYISSPNKYYRVIGEDWPPMVAVQSVLKHGKLWLAENDTRTNLTTPLKERAPHIPPAGQYEGGVWDGPKDINTSVAFLWKNAGRMLAYGYGGWWFDMWGGWYDTPEMLNVIRLTKEYYTNYTGEEESLMQPQVCVVADEQLCFMDASYGELTEKVISNSYSIARVGVPFDHYLRTDLITLPFDRYKVIWLLGLLKLSKEEELLIRQLRNKGITVMWSDGYGTHLFTKEKELFVEGVTKFTDSQLRTIFQEAGAHIYSESGDVFYIGRNWMCIHSTFGGDRTISLPFRAQVIDPSTRKVLHNSTQLLQLSLESKSTVILRINPIKQTTNENTH